MSGNKKLKKANAPGAAATGFISFSDVAADAAGESPSRKGAADSNVYTGGNPEISILVRKVTKKDHTTRLRALRELKELLQVQCPLQPAEMVSSHPPLLYTVCRPAPPRTARGSCHTLRRSTGASFSTTLDMCASR